MRPANTLLIWISLWLTALAPAELLSEDREETKWDPQGLQSEMEAMIQAHRGEVGFQALVLDNANQVVSKFEHRADVVMPTASLIKLPVLIEAYRQAELEHVDLRKKLALSEEDKVPGSGILTSHFSAGVELPLQDVIRLMIRYSDNTATNLVLDTIGLDSTNRWLASEGYPETQIHAKVYRRDTSIAPERSRQYGLGSTRACDMVDLLARLLEGSFVNDTSREAILEHLRQCEDERKLGRDLPRGVSLAHKTGAVNRSRTDAGILYVGEHKIVVCILTTNNEDSSWGDANQAELLIGRLGRMLAEFVLQQSAARPKAKVLAKGTHGDLVETLQRTLNARLETQISVDGDFGPATEAAVKEFQRITGLKENGEVEATTWAALGKLIENDAPVPSPEIVNSRELSLDPPLDLSAPPATTAKAWAVLDLETGELIAEKQGEEPRDIASTTKLMTAYLVFDWAVKHPEAMEEMVTFSARADQTVGSTAGVREGEQLPVRELLYGLLLPSGNDASVALAEHFGERLSKWKEGKEYTMTPAAAYELFIGAMNQKAKELGLEQTHFVNPHGLTEEGHHSSACDLAKLAQAAWALPELRKYVRTRERGCRLESIHGYTRDVVWTNTNRLLSQEGFLGLKTGTTSAAGACLVAAGEYASKECVVVVLGCADSDARYIDARNLFRWCWSRPEK